MLVKRVTEFKTQARKCLERFVRFWPAFLRTGANFILRKIYH
jgi:hypothetical protein